MKWIRRSLLSVMVLFSCLLRGQEMPGLVNGNYQSVSSVWLNPSAPLHGKPWLDVQIAALGLFVDNTAFYIPGNDFAWYKLLSSSYTLPKYGKYERPYVVSEGKKLHQAFLMERFQLPGFQYVDHDYSLGFQWSVRAALSGRRLPYEAMNFAYFDLGYPPQQYIEYTDYDITAAAMNWVEIGVNYGRTVRYRRFTIVNAGASLKRVLATSGAYLDIDKVKYLVHNDSTVDFRSLDAEFGVAAPLDYNTNEYSSALGPFVGSGFSLDLGVTLVRTLHEIKRMNTNNRPCDWRFIPYKYRLGFSLMDFGWASFGTNAQVHAFENVAHFWDRIDTIEFSNIHAAFRDLSLRFYGDSLKSLKANSFSMGLPAAVSLQFDYFLRGHWYLNATWVQGIPTLASQQVHRSPWLAITPRYESELFEFSLPVSFYDYRQPRLGLAFRILGVSFGTDKLGTLLGMGDFYGMDIYLSFRFSLLKGFCPKSKDHSPCGSLDFE